jgi:hypothetical protein
MKEDTYRVWYGEALSGEPRSASGESDSAGVSWTGVGGNLGIGRPLLSLYTRPKWVWKRGLEEFVRELGG